MILLGHALREHRRAIERDLLELGYHFADVGSRLTVSELVSIILTAPAHSAYQHALEGGWSKTDQLLANLTEQDAGLWRLTDRYTRPGVVPTPVDTRPVDPVTGNPKWEGMTVDELERLRRRHTNRGKRNG